MILESIGKALGGNVKGDGSEHGSGGNGNGWKWKAITAGLTVLTAAVGTGYHYYPERDVERSYSVGRDLGVGELKELKGATESEFASIRRLADERERRIVTNERDIKEFQQRVAAVEARVAALERALESRRR